MDIRERDEVITLLSTASSILNEVISDLSEKNTRQKKDAIKNLKTVLGVEDNLDSE